MSGLTPSALLEIRRVKAMIAVPGSSVDPQCFQGPQGPQGPPGPPGPSGNYGIPASLGFYNHDYQYQIIPSNSLGLPVIWNVNDTIFTQGSTGISFTPGQTTFYNYSNDSILLNVTGYISFNASPVGTGSRTVYAILQNDPTHYGYIQLPYVFTGDPMVVSFSFNIFVKHASSFQIYAAQDSGQPSQINVTGSKISMIRINTSIIGPPGTIDNNSGSGGPQAGPSIVNLQYI